MDDVADVISTVNAVANELHSPEEEDANRLVTYVKQVQKDENLRFLKLRQ
jgi:hypothetical protein